MEDLICFILTPCLQEVLTGEIVETEVVRIRRTSFLQKFNKKNGWYTSWNKLARDNEIYALVIKGTVDIQGLVAIRDDKDMQAAYVSWMVAAPQNNPQIVEQKKYMGVGGHLFAIAAAKSEEYGYNCEMTGFAANEQLEQHYVDNFDAIRIHMLHPYQILITEDAGKRIKKAYTYEWKDDEL